MRRIEPGMKSRGLIPLNGNTAKSKKRDSGLWIAIGIAVILMAVNTPLVGIHGILLFIAGDQLAMQLLGKLHGDYYWPIGLYIGFLWPPGVPISYVIATRINIPKVWGTLPGLFRAFIFIGLLYVWTAILSTTLHLLALWQAIG